MRALSIIFALAVFFSSALALGVLTEVVNEGFEGGSIPTGWQNWVLGVSDVPWYISSGSPHTGTYHAQHDWSWSGPCDDWLVTETYDLTYFNDLSYSFWHSGYDASYYTYTGFWISDVEDPDDSDFVELVELGAPPTGYQEVTGDISAYIGEEFVTFAWVYQGYFGHGHYIDDILIQGDAPLATIQPTSLGHIKTLMK